MKPLAAIKVLRPTNCFMAALATAIGYWASLSRFLVTVDLFTAMLAAFLVCGAGQAINDYFDRSIDRKTKPHRPIPSGKLSARFVLAESLFLFVAGNALAYQVNAAAFLISLVFTGLLLAYSSLLKKMKYVGNWIVASGTAVTLLFGASVSGSYFPVIFLAFSAMLANLGRELTKDLEDLEGDQGHKVSLPMLIGHSPVKSLILFCYAFAVAVALFAGTRYYYEKAWFFPLIVFSGIVFAYAGFQALSDEFRKAQGLSKQAMMLALLAFASVVL
ncbi:MAG TPA: UbiA family prenyltransferase [Candidatus Diapherotrites archaeon]|uniref:Geranylgeranylglycerol-phosphate geranylgeranyltransferase n=1 Tax=Candidatus Iainarchaeum sp. TaxID=3101447 RepID=A0A7J4JH59_9ARCH|nr:geranylgeranylglycerol-phosphate geranylgeranyltransferase [Candidatus Diapherotrites archaeon]HIH17082.1 UbiA family prenyltransferase [Candidatus Diapherotrites archaeon]